MIFCQTSKIYNNVILKIKLTIVPSELKETVTVNIIATNISVS